MFNYDHRLNSLEQAVQTAQAIGCAGIVTNSAAFHKSLNLIPFIRSQGLRVYSYGNGNNYPDFAVDQIKAGIDGIIVDDLKVIKKALNY